MKIVDPPEGWRYGFPKPMPADCNFAEWLIENGYPEEKLDLALRWSRFWEEPDIDTKTSGDR